ncbi:phosphoribosyltransferase [Microbacterium sp. ASV49]|uniref:Phosphoribosyltransferase family protein n=1 Tax=Microbacterium candidum TaxID=3041922 RepID=A0ABT7MZD6_9MICO|nr:phosphoribosyltransferase family protein [Microbacterium sp. ASV49]MDL9979812.1 phosphoribosyltransferase family protein [Microbacterium sp. ASV49]
MAMFADRVAAGRQLAQVLDAGAYPDAVVFGIPRGGVVVAAEVARTLGVPLAAVVVRKLGAPSNMEFAIGAIAKEVTVVNPDAVRTALVTAEQLAFIEDVERVELDRRARAFAPEPLDITNRTAMVVDDGIATGATATAACQELRRRGAARVVLAVPVAPADWHPSHGAVDEYVCLHVEPNFWAVGQFYDDFTQTTDAEVVELLSHDLRDGPA